MLDQDRTVHVLDLYFGSNIQSWNLNRLILKIWSNGLDRWVTSNAWFQISQRDWIVCSGCKYDWIKIHMGVVDIDPKALCSGRIKNLP